jgi:uncharacterized protein
VGIGLSGISSMGRMMALALVCTMTAAVLFQPVLMGTPRQIKADSPVNKGPGRPSVVR